MPFVRKHGNQVAIVHGERDADGKVQQRVLFTLYSRPEAEAAIGARQTDPPLSLHRLVESRHDGIRFDWPKIDAAIAALKHELPDAWTYPDSGVEPLVRAGVVDLTRALFAADPRSVFSGAHALREHGASLRVLRELIDARLDLVEKVKEDRWNRDNEYGWRARVGARGAPPEAEEWVAGYRERGEDDRAEALVGVLVQAWPEYADGYNTLGMIALDRDQLEAALGWFAKAMEVGRTLFPKRIAKGRWWSDHETRPYMRGMRNTAQTLGWLGRDEEVLSWCDRLASECFDEDSAAVFRASALLNLGRWEEARASAARYVELWPAEDFVAAFAAFELGDREDALARWLHAAIQRPRSARMLTGGSTPGRPCDREEVEDHNGGVATMRSLGRFLKRRPARRFFAAVTQAPEVVALIEERRAVVAAWRADRGGEDRSGYARMQEMGTTAFARKEARRLAHLGCAESGG